MCLVHVLVWLVLNSLTRKIALYSKITKYDISIIYIHTLYKYTIYIHHIHTLYTYARIHYINYLRSHNIYILNVNNVFTKNIRYS